MTTPNLQLPEVPEAIQEASDEINAGFLRLDAVVQLAVLDKDLAAPPVSPVQGDRYIVPIGATGAWSGRDRSIAFRGPSGWNYYVPRPGWRAWVLDEEKWYLYSETSWSVDGGGGSGGATTPAKVTWVRAQGAIAVPVNDVDLYFHDAATIAGIVITTKSAAGSCVIDIWAKAIGSYPPAVGDTIFSAGKPTISGARTYVDTTLTGVATAIAAGTVLTLHLDSSTVFKSIQVFLVLA